MSGQQNISLRWTGGSRDVSPGNESSVEGLAFFQQNFYFAGIIVCVRRVGILLRSNSPSRDYPSTFISRLFAYFSVSASAERAAAPLCFAGDKYYECSLNGRRMLFNYPFEPAWPDSGVEWMLPNLNAIWTRFSHWFQCTLQRKYASWSIFLLHRVYASTSIRFSKREKERKEKEEERATREEISNIPLCHPFNPRSELRAASIVGERIDTRHRRYLTGEPIKMDFDRPTPSIQMTMLSGLSFRVILQIFARRSRGGTMYASINISMLPTNVGRRFVDRVAKNRPGLHFPNGTISRFRSRKRRRGDAIAWDERWNTCPVEKEGDGRWSEGSRNE